MQILYNDIYIKVLMKKWLSTSYIHEKRFGKRVLTQASRYYVLLSCVLQRGLPGLVPSKAF
jgi:hypothetical protein